MTKLVECLAAIMGLIYYQKYKSTKVKYFIFFLVYVAILELIGGYTIYVDNYEFLKNVKAALKGTLIERNFWWYNLFWNVGSALFFAFYFREVVKNKSFKIILKYIGILFFVVSMGYYLNDLHTFFTNFIPFTSIFSSIVKVLSIILYLIEILQSDKIMVFYKSMNFYIGAPMLIWCLVLTPLTFYNIYFSRADWNFVFLKQYIYLFSNMFLYLTYTFALIWCKPQND